MKKLSLSRWALIAGVVVGVIQIAVFGPHLSGKVASHFGPSGQADSFMESSAFLAMHSFVLAICTVSLGSIGLMLPSLPDGQINIPNREYYLAPERRAATLGFISDRMQVFGAATLALVAGVFQAVYEANLKGTNSIGTTPLFLVGLYLLYTIFWLFGLMRYFRPPAY